MFNLPLPPRHEWFTYALRFRMVWHAILHALSLLFILLWNNNPTSEYLLLMVFTQFVVMCIHILLAAQNEKKESTLIGHYIHVGMLLLTPALLIIYGALWLDNYNLQWNTLWDLKTQAAVREVPNTLGLFFFMLTSSSVALSLTYTLRQQYTPSTYYPNKRPNTRRNPMLPDAYKNEKLTLVACLLCLSGYAIAWLIFGSPLPAWILHISFFYCRYAYMEHYLFMTSCNALWYTRMIRYHKPQSFTRWKWLMPHQHDMDIAKALISGMNITELLKWSGSMVVHSTLVQNQKLRELWLNELALHKPIAHIAWDLNPSLTYADTIMGIQEVSTSETYNIALI